MMTMGEKFNKTTHGERIGRGAGFCYKTCSFTASQLHLRDFLPRSFKVTLSRLE